MGKYIFGIVVIGVTVVATCIFHTESYFPLYPSIDTVLPPNFIKKFHQVRLGMSTTDVASLLGKPSYGYEGGLSKIFQQTSGVVEPCWSYGEDGAAKFWDFAWLSYCVCFNNEGRVIQTGIVIHGD